MALTKGDLVTYDQKVWKVVFVWDTLVEGHRADLISVDQPPVACSVNVDDLERMD